MKSLLLRHGDLVLSAKGHATVDGGAKVVQDLSGAILEPVGNDRFHPGFGSTLDDFVGGWIDSETAFNIKQEIRRVVSNYAAVQVDKIQRDVLRGVRSRFRNDEVVDSVTSISATQDGDTLRLKVSIRTSDGSSVTLDLDSSIGA